MKEIRMRKTQIFIVVGFLLSISQLIFAQGNRIQYNNQDLFLSGVNLAWMSFANDIGPGQTNFAIFADFFLAIHDSGGNAVRWWLHTNGSSSPEFNSNSYVIDPGQGTIQDLKTILDIAWEREVGVILCLWSFDMLRKSNSSTLIQRNTLLLSDTNYTRAYINNCLIPMVDSLKRHPAIIAWEIFNEPEGMSNEFGWSDINHVPMSSIQRFVNLCAGAIHRTDTSALVTNGTWSFKALTDIQISASMQKVSAEQRKLQAAQLIDRYNFTLSVEEVSQYLDRLAVQANYNYYRDDRLISAGGDPDGTLDFYCVHYYVGTGPSPFRNSASAWGITKPIVVAEFHTTDTDGVPKQYLYPTLYSNGYAGALAWSWTDNAVSQKSDMLNALRFMWNNYRSAVDVNGISGEWPRVTLTSPTNDAKFNSGAEITIEATASDPDGEVIAVEFFISDTIKIGVDSTVPYSFIWSGMIDGNYSLTAIAKDNIGNKRKSNIVKIQIGAPPFFRYEAERATRSGTGMSVKFSAVASSNYFVDVATNAAGTTITWTFTNVFAAGNYDLIFGYNLYYDSPKGQFINVNGSRIGELMFDGVKQTWLEKKMNVPLILGSNSVQMEMSWGWMYVDYLDVPREVVTSVMDEKQIPLYFSLEQNYPNPFNPNTVISYHLPARLPAGQASQAGLSVISNVTLCVYDILGREVATLVNEVQPAGSYSIKWDASKFASGVYFYKIQAGTFSQVKKMLLIR